MPESKAGEPAVKLGGGWERIGPEECPLFFRRTLVDWGWTKVLWHRWVPGSTDTDPHDHPRSFVTFVLRGGYDDLTLCPRCDGDGSLPSDVGPVACMLCGETGRLVERLRAPAVRFRRAEHAHNTRTHDDGATTLVVMGPLARAWGFIRSGVWWPWRDYEREFGLGMRCEDER